MKDRVKEFQEYYPSIESYWRSIILFGRNVATYKFALAKSLLELANKGKTEITLEELSEPYTRNLCEHIKKCAKQTTSKSSRFLKACADYNDGKITHQELIKMAICYGFNNVIDAFHVVGKKEIPVKFYEKDYKFDDKKIILTDNMFKLIESPNG
ncbi:MAG: hypothetical protein DUD27_03265 [Lachnospiraceae bacterium]|uniref:Uncharacterized protein n=1 Tax=Candidatus Weimeria bifida TaxID=2599074 RepID=A0A6N7IY14_9FIRM|nr:hypothetical protein [Candidatus Weimeria bifida]RRF96643.1 MAG: hypothetical protein DUD27_03265 [Lachnospiraceae bacterium]